jgi:acetyl-CoA acetyltransferase
MEMYGTTTRQLAEVSVAIRHHASLNPDAVMRRPFSIDDHEAARFIAAPLRLLDYCLINDGAVCLIVTTKERAKDFKTKPVYILGTGESAETPMVSQMEDFTSSRAFRVAGPTAFQQAGISPTVNDVDHLMIYDAFAHLPIYGLEDLGFLPRGEAAAFIAGRNTAPGGILPLNTNGGGLSYMHSGMYGMYALQESVRQMRGTAAAQVPNAKISVCHGVGGMFAASGTIIFTNDPS